MVKLLSQRDPRWSKIPINDTIYSIGDYGCLITCLAMLGNRDVDAMEQFLQENKLFYGAKLSSFDIHAYDSSFPVLGSVSKVYERVNYPYVGQVIEQLKNGDKVIIQVDFTPSPGLQSHYVLAVDTDGTNIFIYDPWTGTRENLTKYGKDNAWAIVQSVQYFPATDQYKTTTNLRVRSTPEINATNIMGLLPEGTQVTIKDFTGNWGRTEIPIQLSGVQLTPVSGYLYKDYLSPVGTPPPNPLPVATFRVGVHTIDDYGAANEAGSLRAPYITVLDNRDAARELATRYPQSTVIYRAWYPYQANVQALIGKLNISPNDPPMLYVGLNEDDSIGSLPDDIRNRAILDAQVAQYVKSQNPKNGYLAGSFSHGVPDFTNPEICDVIREHYAPNYNRGLFGFDMHNYTYGKRFPSHPPQCAEIIDPIWFERRWEFLFTKCGFDPNIRNIWATESGVEARCDSYGGFSSNPYSIQQFKEWFEWYVQEMSRPLSLNGKNYQSPIIGSTIYMYGANQTWKGYDVRMYKDVLVPYWSALWIK